MITGLPTAPLASRLINQRAAAPWITLPRRASLIDSKILSKQTEPALLLAYNLIRAVMAQAAFLGHLLPRQLSFKATLQLVRAFEENLRHAPREPLALRRAFLLAGVSRLRLPDRPGRVEPRAVKRRAKPQSLLTQPRHILETALMKQQQMLHDKALR